MEQPEIFVDRGPAEGEQRRGGFFSRLFRRQPPPPSDERPTAFDAQMHLYIDERIESAPDKEGVIALWERTTLIYLGAASRSLGGIRGELQAKRREGGCTQSATHFQWEVTEDSAARLRDLLDDHRHQHSAVPRCNQ